MSKMQSPDEGAQRAHLPQAAEVKVPEVRQGQDAEAEVTREYYATPGGFGLRRAGYERISPFAQGKVQVASLDRQVVPARSVPGLPYPDRFVDVHDVR